MLEGIFNHGNSFSIGRQVRQYVWIHPEVVLLLHGVDATYETMYRKASATIFKNLLFRPMMPKKLNMLFSSAFDVEGQGPARSLDPASCLFRGRRVRSWGRLSNVTEHNNIGARLTDFLLISCRRSPRQSLVTQRQAASAWANRRSKASDLTTTAAKIFPGASSVPVVILLIKT